MDIDDTIQTRETPRVTGVEALLRYVDEALRESDLDASSLVVEITESVMMTDVQAIGRQLQAVRQRGVRVAVDDFGTGAGGAPGVPGGPT